MTKKEMKIGDEIFANRERETALNTHTLDFGVSPLVNGSNANRHGVVSHLSRLFRDNTILSVKTPDRSANEQLDFTTLIFLFFAHLQIKY